MSVTTCTPLLRQLRNLRPRSVALGRRRESESDSSRAYATSAWTVSRQLRNPQTMATFNKANEQIFDYFLVLDFEATCDKDTHIKPQVCELMVMHF